MTPEDIRHGTSSGYRKHGCRCDACTEYNRQAVADWRERNERRRAELGRQQQRLRSLCVQFMITNHPDTYADLLAQARREVRR